MDVHLWQMRRYGCVCFQADAFLPEGVVRLHPMSFTQTSAPRVAPPPDGAEPLIQAKPTSGASKADEQKFLLKISGAHLLLSAVTVVRRKERQSLEEEQSENAAGVSGWAKSAASICLHLQMRD